MDWLDEQDFYEICQQYRHSNEFKRWSTQMTTVEAFEALKTFIRRKIKAEIKIATDAMYIPSA